MGSIRLRKRSVFLALVCGLSHLQISQAQIATGASVIGSGLPTLSPSATGPASAAIITSAASSQVDQILQRQEHERRIRQAEHAASPDSLQPDTPNSASLERLPEETPCFVITDIRIDTSLSQHDWHAALNGANGDDSPMGRCLGGLGISLLITRLQNAVLRAGYITSEVYAPQQSLVDGILTLAMHEGRVAAIQSPVASSAWALQPGDILNLRALEQTADTLSRLSGLGSHLQIKPGRDAASSDITLQLRKQADVRISIGLHDGGNRSTGQLMRTTSLAWDNPLGIADQLYVSECASVGWREDGERNNRCTALYYSIPMGWWMLGGNLSNSRFYQTVLGAFQNYRYSGQSRQAELTAQRVVHRSGHSISTAFFSVRQRASSNFIDGEEIDVQRRRTSLWEAALQHVEHSGVGQVSARLGIRHGMGAFGALPPPEAASGQASARMQLVTAQLSHTRSLDVSGQQWAYAGDVLTQWNQTSLTPQDRFCVGFRGSLRGLDGQQTACGNRGWQWRNELSTSLGPWLQALSAAPVNVYAAIDMARVSETGFASQLHFSSFALGLRGAFNTTQSSRLSWDVFIGTPLSKPDHFQTAGFASGFNLRIDF